MSNQSAKQASIRAVTSTTGTYEEDWHSLFDLHSIDAGTFNERLLLWINAKLAASHTNLIDAQQALAAANSVANWDSMGTFDATAPEKEPNMTTEKSLREQLEEAYTEVTTPEDVADTQTDDVTDVVDDKPERARDETGKFTKKEATEEIVEAPELTAEPAAPVLEAPQAWTGPMKEKWGTLAPDVQAEILRRENDIHKMFTSKEGDLRLGREMKDVIGPYMPIITAEGGNPVAAVQSLLNTAYQLRTGSPQQKAALIREIAETYGVDLGQPTQTQGGYVPQSDLAKELIREFEQLKQTLNPDAIMSHLQEKQENDRIHAEVNAFAANPANKHYEQVKAFMAPLLASGQAKDLQEAYDMACYANPSIRSTLLQEQDAERQAKRKAELTAKKQAAVSVTGSPSANAGNAKSPERTLREELRANLVAITGSKI